MAVELIDGALADPASGYEVLVVMPEEGGGPVGYTSFGPTPMTTHTYDLYWLAVDPGQRGRGLGAALVRALEDALRNRGGRIIRVETSSQDAYDGTLAFYERTGFVTGGRIPHFYRQDDDLLILYKTVD